MPQPQASAPSLTHIIVVPLASRYCYSPLSHQPPHYHHIWTHMEFSRKKKKRRALTASPVSALCCRRRSVLLRDRDYIVFNNLKNG
ncbi:hypothetical protein L1987_21784 [Smallanthus sonchifolius]|uniref:Uncharacterized protein n=1 Tax=Smallanthus sonchifolius TaxID=185202 RepID=A0ACB9IDP3_9ASTR|nr:hypothetical protein L1987_21784 [Smallanthus sonchifolius]